MKFFTIAAVAAVAVEARKLTFGKTKGPAEELCGRGIDALNGGTQDYIASTKDELFSHRGTKQDVWNVFESEIKCWFASMVSKKCGGMAPNPARKEALHKACTDDTVTKNDIMSSIRKESPLLSQEEYKYYRSSYPNREDGENYSETMKTLEFAAGKEMLCLTLFTIDDGCVQHSYIKTK